MSTHFAIGLQSVRTGKIYNLDVVEYVDPETGGNLDVQYDYDAINAYVREHGLTGQPGMWRYRALLPLDFDAPVPPLFIGGTPMYANTKLASRFGVKQIWLKDDSRNPTASFKDRASALVVARAIHEGREVITTASTGNAGAALSGVAASVSMPNVIFAPATAPPAKVAQLLAYGSTVLLVEGTYSQAFDLCLEATAEFDWYCRNTGYNPYTQEGKKTVSYEIAEQFSMLQYGDSPGTFKAPDRIFVSVGDGNIIAGVHKGFKDMLALGWIDTMPTIIGVQAEGSASFYHAWKNNIDPADIQPIDAQTIADSISAGLPRDRVKAMRAVTETGGFWMTVSDDEILHAIPDLAQSTGIFAEPAASAAFAGLVKAADEGQLPNDEHVVVLVTGSGLKDVDAAKKAVSEAYRIQPRLEDVVRVMQSLDGKP